MSLLWAASTAADVSGHHWSIAPLPHHIKRLISPSLGVSADGSVYLFGGRDLGTTLLSDTCYKYSLVRGMWEEVGSTHPRPPPRAGATLVGAGGDLLLFGGRRDRPRSAALQPSGSELVAAVSTVHTHTHTHTLSLRLGCTHT